MTSYPPTCDELLAEERTGQPAPPPTYEDSIKPAPQSGKPMRPAPPYCAIDQTSRPCPTPATGAYPPAPYPTTRRTEEYDRQRTISIAPAPHVPQQPDLVAGQCHKFEAWLASKTGMRICLVTVIMMPILAVVAAIIGSGVLTALFVVVGLCALGLLIWSTSLRRQVSKMAAQNERRSNINRVEIRDTSQGNRGW